MRATNGSIYSRFIKIYSGIIGQISRDGNSFIFGVYSFYAFYKNTGSSVFPPWAAVSYPSRDSSAYLQNPYDAVLEQLYGVPTTPSACPPRGPNPQAGVADRIRNVGEGGELPVGDLDRGLGVRRRDGCGGSPSSRGRNRIKTLRSTNF